MAGLASGSFTIDKLPQEDSTLLLVVHRHDRASMAVSFMSHVFARLSGPQVALLDAYQGVAASVVQIQKDEKPETLSFNSVMALDEATYEAGAPKMLEKKSDIYYIIIILYVYI